MLTRRRRRRRRRLLWSRKSLNLSRKSGREGRLQSRGSREPPSAR
jgi:hypothetical protein